MLKTAIHSLLRGPLTGLCLAASLSVQAAVVQPADPADVGQINLVIGKAYLVHADESREPIAVGSTVKVGDRIQTRSNAHVHIRFVDQAMVSVRPFSELQVQRYDYRPEDPAASVVKFKLLEGVTRAISGEAAESARQNFRLNTPVAAIGVRGTDFVVQANGRESRALVNQGTIVMAPFSSTCLADAFGPCSDSGLELSGNDRLMAMVAADSTEPVLIPENGNGVAETLLAGSVAEVQEQEQQQQRASEPQEDSGNDLYTESVSTRVVRHTLAKASDRPIPPAERDYTPPLAVTAASTVSKQLVWGRWAWAEDLGSRDLLSVSKDVAETSSAITSGSAAKREVTVGNNHYVLYRVENGPTVVKPGLGVVNFDLQQAQAFYVSGGVSSLMSVQGGALAIDFDGGRFSTSLNLRHDATGAVNFSEAGRLYNGGYFHPTDKVGQKMAGATTLDGSEAAYFFEKTLENGLIEGLTNWGRRP
ncbi:MAG TPA: FecR domain-containing protein [Hyphomicrobiales bacterium]|nr:FecR domain-containing protein [Hyphomicrobiales bacterium]